jgi:hypothetical protein
MGRFVRVVFTLRKRGQENEIWDEAKERGLGTRKRWKPNGGEEKQ